MEKESRILGKPQTYAKISLQKRYKLIKLIEQSSITITKAARKMGIKLSTANLILKKYREEGTFFQKRADRLKRLQAMKHSSEMSIIQSSPQIHSQIPQITHNTGSIEQYWIQEQYWIYNPTVIYSPNYALGNEQNLYTSFMTSGHQINAIFYAGQYWPL